MISVTIRFSPEDQLTYELEHGEHGMLIHSPCAGVVHVEHVRLPLVKVEDAPNGGRRLKVIDGGLSGAEPIERTIPPGTKFS